MYSYNTTYIPCVFCRTTIPSEQMAAHLAQCQQAIPSMTPAPYGTSQSVQYRRIVRVERKTCDERNVASQPYTTVYQPQMPVPMIQGVATPAVPPQYPIPTQPSFIPSTPSKTITPVVPGPPIQVIGMQPTVSYHQEQSTQYQSGVQSNQSQRTPSFSQQPIQTLQTSGIQQQVRISQNQSNGIQQQQQVFQQKQQPIHQQSIYQNQSNGNQQQQQQPIPQNRSNGIQKQQQPSTIGKVEVINPGSLSDRIRMFENKSTVPNPPIVSEQPVGKEKSQNITRNRVNETMEQPEQRAKMREWNSNGQEQMNNISTSTPLPPTKPSLPIKPSVTNKAVINQPPQIVQKTPGKISIPKSTPGQLSLDEMLKKKQQQGVKYDCSFSDQPKQTQIQEQQQPIPSPVNLQVTVDQRNQRNQRNQSESSIITTTQSTPGKLSIPQSIPGQLSLDEMLQKKQQQQHTFHMERTECHTINTSNGTVTQQHIQQEHCEEKKEECIYQNNQTPSSMPTEQTNEYTPPSSSNQCEYEVANAFLAMLTKDDMKRVFSTDSPLMVNGTANVIVSVFPMQLCVYEYSAQTQSYQLLVHIISSPYLTFRHNSFAVIA